MEDWISQGLFVIGYIIMLSAYLFKRKDAFMICNIVGNIFLTSGYLVLGEYTGLVGAVLTIFRCATFAVLAKKNINKNYIFLTLLELITIFGFIYTWEGVYSIIMLIANIIFTYACWQDNRTVMVWINVYFSMSILTYNVLIWNISPIIMESIYSTILIVSFFIGLAKRKQTKSE